MPKLEQENYIVDPDDQLETSDPLNYTVIGSNARVEQSSYSSEHFETFEIIMPYVNGVCTIPEGVSWTQGYHTPLTCVEPSNDFITYYFGSENVPIGFFEQGNFKPIYRQIKTISEVTPEIKPAGGLASRGALKIVFNDFEGDSGPVNTTDKGTYFQKFLARNIFSGRTCTIKRWVRINGVNSLVSSSVYVSESMTSTSSGDYVLQCKSQLEYTYKDSTQFPEPTGARLRLDVDNSVTKIPVNRSEFNWIAGIVIRIGDELMQVSSYDDLLQELTVLARGSSIVGTSITLSTTEADSHSEGDDIQVCWVSNDESISSFISTILTLSGIPSSYINEAAWQSEFDDYWADSKLNMIWSEPESVSSILELLSKDYMLDIWEEATTPASIKLSAVSAWKETSLSIFTGRQITQDTLRVSPKPEMRSSRSYIYYDKENKTDNEDRGNYKKLSLNIDTTYEGVDFYGTKKEADLGSSPILDTNDASLRTQRQTARFNLSPVAYEWEGEEKYLNYSVGDIVEFTNRDITDAQGDQLKVRAQITSLTPKYKYKGVGRGYKIKALTYTPAIITGGGGSFTKIVSGATLSEVDIHNDYADRTNSVVDFTLILDNCTVVGDDNVNPSIRNGTFSSGSSVTIILVNGTDWQSYGGEGGRGAAWESVDTNPITYVKTIDAGTGESGGVCFNADGVPTNIYLSGATGNASYPTALGSIKAGGGGGNGSDGNPYLFPVAPENVGDGGGGGAGNISGVGGAAGVINYAFFGNVFGEQGNSGSSNGTGGAATGTALSGGDWGKSGGAFSGVSGAAGSGIIKSGADVFVFGSTPTNFINGNGDTPN